MKTIRQFLTDLIAGEEIACLKLQLNAARDLAKGLMAEMENTIHAKNARIAAMDAELDWKARVIADLSDKIHRGEKSPIAREEECNGLGVAA